MASTGFGLSLASAAAAEDTIGATICVFDDDNEDDEDDGSLPLLAAVLVKGASSRSLIS